MIFPASPEMLRFGAVAPLGGAASLSSGGTLPDSVAPIWGKFLKLRSFDGRERCYGRNIGCYAIIFPACYKFGYRRNSDDVPRFA